MSISITTANNIRSTTDRQPGFAVVLASGYSTILAQTGSGGFELLQKTLTT